MPALRKADQVAAPGMQGGMGVRFLPVTHWIEPGRTDLCHFANRDMPSWAPVPAGPHATCHPPEKHSTRSPGLLQDSRLLPCNRTPRTRAARCMSPARSCCQAPVPQKDRTDAGRGCEPAARVQPCTAITVLLIPRGFRMSEPGVPRRGQLSRGSAAIPAHVVDVPRCSLLRLAQREKPLLLCQAAGKGNGQTPRTASQPCLLPDTLPALKRLLPTRDGHIPAWPRGRGCPLQLPAMGTT